MRRQNTHKNAHQNASKTGAQSQPENARGNAARTRAKMQRTRHGFATSRRIKTGVRGDTGMRIGNAPSVRVDVRFMTTFLRAFDSAHRARIRRRKTRQKMRTKNAHNLRIVLRRAVRTRFFASNLTPQSRKRRETGLLRSGSNVNDSDRIRADRPAPFFRPFRPTPARSRYSVFQIDLASFRRFEYGQCPLRVAPARA